MEGAKKVASFTMALRGGGTETCFLDISPHFWSILRTRVGNCVGNFRDMVNIFLGRQRQTDNPIDRQTNRPTKTDRGTNREIDTERQRRERLIDTERQRRERDMIMLTDTERLIDTN